MLRMLVRFSLIVSLTVSMGLSASATWTLHNVAFNDGGTASGSFVYDATTNTYSSINITTTSGSILPGATYTAVNSNMSGWVTSTAVNLLTQAGLPNYNNSTTIFLFMATALTNAGGTVNLANNAGAEDTCSSTTCNTNQTPLRIINGGGYVTGVPLSSPTPTVPALTWWGLIVLGIGLAATAIALSGRHPIQLA